MSAALKLSLLIVCCFLAANASPISKDIFQTVASDLREGDIKIELKKSKSLGVNVDYNKWPAGVVPYEFASGHNTTERTKIVSGMTMITNKTGGCITFTPKRQTDTHWLSIIKFDYTVRDPYNSGCWSYPGRNYNQGAQQLSLGEGCVYTGTIVHELCHALGFLHEQNRNDRDEFITINRDNIQADALSQFEKYPAGDYYYGTTYDYYSIMHYDRYAFTKDQTANYKNFPTIIPKQAGIDLIPAYDKTDDQILTAKDILAIQTMYQCATNPITTTTTIAPSVTTGLVDETTKPPVTTTTTKKPSGSLTLKLKNNRGRNIWLMKFDSEDNYTYNEVEGKSNILKATSEGEFWYVIKGRKYAWFKIGEDLASDRNGNGVVVVKVSKLRSRFTRF